MQPWKQYIKGIIFVLCTEGWESDFSVASDINMISRGFKGNILNKWIDVPQLFNTHNYALMYFEKKLIKECDCPKVHSETCQISLVVSLYASNVIGCGFVP